MHSYILYILIINHNWDSFTMGAVPRKKVRFRDKDTDEIHQMATKFCMYGNLSKALKVVTSVELQSTTGTVDSLEKLKSKHPQAGDSRLLSTQKDQTNSFSGTNYDHTETVVATENEVENSTRAVRSATTSGLDHFCPEDLKQLQSLLDSHSPDNTQFRGNVIDTTVLRVQ